MTALIDRVKGWLIARHAANVTRAYAPRRSGAQSTKETR